MRQRWRRQGPGRFPWRPCPSWVGGGSGGCTRPWRGGWCPARACSVALRQVGGRIMSLVAAARRVVLAPAAMCIFSFLVGFATARFWHLQRCAKKTSGVRLVVGTCSDAHFLVFVGFAAARFWHLQRCAEKKGRASFVCEACDCSMTRSRFFVFVLAVTRVGGLVGRGRGCTCSCRRPGFVARTQCTLRAVRTCRGMGGLGLVLRAGEAGPRKSRSIGGPAGAAFTRRGVSVPPDRGRMYVYSLVGSVSRT